jgi:hypothetical protein
MNHPGWVLHSDVLKAIPFPRLQGLNLATEVAGLDAKASQTLLLQNRNPFKERFDPLKIFCR